jgi:hypothetical protein
LTWVSVDFGKIWIRQKLAPAKNCLLNKLSELSALKR